MRVDFSKETIKAKAKDRFGDDFVDVSDPYWIDFDYETCGCRVGVELKDGISFGANYDFVNQKFL